MEGLTRPDRSPRLTPSRANDLADFDRRRLNRRISRIVSAGKCSVAIVVSMGPIGPLSTMADLVAPLAVITDPWNGSSGCGGMSLHNAVE